MRCSQYTLPVIFTFVFFMVLLRGNGQGGAVRNPLGDVSNRATRNANPGGGDDRGDDDDNRTPRRLTREEKQELLRRQREREALRDALRREGRTSPTHTHPMNGEGFGKGNGR